MTETIPQLESIEYAEFRPTKIRTLSKDELLLVIDKSLAPIETRRAKSMDMANLCLLELKARRRRRPVNDGLAVFRKHNVEPIVWFEDARKIATKCLRVAESKRKKGNVYVILRDGYLQGGPYGVYVGSTRLSVEERFAQHRAGVRAARGLEEHAIELMYSLFDWMNPVPGKTVLLRREETRLHRCLATVVPSVSGDVVSEDPSD